MSDPAAGKALVPARHEASDVGLRFMLALFALVGGTLLLVVALAYVVFPGEVPDRRFALPLPRFPVPRLQNDPAADMQALLAAERRRLDSVGWQDRDAGVVHIPIAQAMRALAQQGIPGWPAPGERR
jgi:hypothetical protein